MTATTSPGMRLCDRAEYAGKPEPLAMPAKTPLPDAVASMVDRNYGSVIVVDPDHGVEGIVTERDILKRVVHAGREVAKTTLGDIMTPTPRVARETDDIIDWLRMMSNERFRRLPVVDEAGRVKAVFTQGDFVSYTWPDLLHQVKDMARATIGRNWALFLIGGGILLYTLAILGVVASMA